MVYMGIYLCGDYIFVESVNYDGKYRTKPGKHVELYAYMEYLHILCMYKISLFWLVTKHTEHKA